LRLFSFSFPFLFSPFSFSFFLSYILRLALLLRCAAPVYRLFSCFAHQLIGSLIDRLTD